MKNILLPVLALGLLVISGGAAKGARAIPQAATQTPDKTAPSYNMKAQALEDLDGMHKQFVSLAEAIPQEKYTWRPGDGVLSIAEVFMHVAGANYGIPSMMGTAVPAGFDLGTYHKTTTDKTQIIAALNKSFDSAHTAIAGITNADFAKVLPKLGPNATAGDVVYSLVTHAHEHLGQSIAYARVNGIVPPWTAEAMKKEKAQN